MSTDMSNVHHRRQLYLRLDSIREVETEIERSTSNSSSNPSSTTSRSTPSAEQPTQSSPGLVALDFLHRAIGHIIHQIHEPLSKIAPVSDKVVAEPSKSTRLPSKNQDTIVMQSEPRHASFQGQCQDGTAHSTQLKTQGGLGERLKKAWKSALPARETCVCCNEEIQTARIVFGPCEHKYCPNCIKKMVSHAMEDKSKFPIKCCAQEIPAKRVASALHGRSRKVYLAQRAEYEFPPSERWYCPHPNCCRWIHPRNLTTRSKPLKCPHCRAPICTNCRDLAHGERECVIDDTLRDILAVARRKNWQRCFRCHALVEKTSGCIHMTCNCKAQFCYVCGDQYPCNSGCRGIAVVHQANGNFEEDGDLDIETVVAAMEQAEREEEEENLRQLL